MIEILSGKVTCRVLEMELNSFESDFCDFDSTQTRLALQCINEAISAVRTSSAERCAALKALQNISQPSAAEQNLNDCFEALHSLWRCAVSDYLCYLDWV